MRVFHCKPVILWFFSVVVTFIVLHQVRPIHKQPSGFTPAHGKKRNPQDLVSEAENLIKVEAKRTNLDKIFKRSNKTLEKLQFFPKLDQAQLLNVALVNRPELKNFLKERFNLTDKNERIGPLEPKMMSSKIHEKNIMLDSIRKDHLKQHQAKLVLNVRNKCLVDKPYVLVFIHSIWNSKEQRQLIRQTWAKVTTYKGHVIRLIFVIAQPNPKLDSASLLKAAADITLERQVFDDIIQGDFVDHYRNLTRKHLLAYQWVLSHCHKAKYIIKVDDDVVVNIFRVVEFLDSAKNPLRDNSDLFYCSAFVRQGPRRDKLDKWYVTKEEYAGDKYPTYCAGFAYITTPGVVLKLYNVSLTVPRYWIDDVYVTGILAESAHVRHKQFRDPNGYNTMYRDAQENYDEVANHALFILAKYKIEASSWIALWEVITKLYPTKDYSVNSRYKQLKYHMPHHTL